MVVPSIWWENSPLVIQEAFHYGRPVICSDIGGMAEKVEHGVNGLHFRAGDAADLARTLEEAVATPGLWEQLRAGIRPVYGMDQHVAALEALYESLLSAKKGRKCRLSNGSATSRDAGSRPTSRVSSPEGSSMVAAA